MNGLSAVLTKSNIKIEKTMKEQTSLLQKIYDEQVTARKAAEKAANAQKQRDKRSGADRVTGTVSNKATEKKKESMLMKVLKGFTDLFKGGIGKILAGLAAAGVGMKAMGGISRIFAGGGLGGIGKGLAGLGTALGKMFKGIGTGLGNLFKGGKGLGLGKVIKGSGIMAALFGGIAKYLETGSYMDALFSGGGAGGGAIAGGALGSLLGPIGTVVGAALGAFVGEQLGGILKEALDKHEWFKSVSSFVDARFEEMLTDFKEFFSAVQTTWGQFTDMVNVLWKSLERFNKEVMAPFFKQIGDFFSDTWKQVTSGFDQMVKFLEPISKYLEPIVKPLKELATKLIDPIVKGLKLLYDKVLKPMLNPLGSTLGAATDGVKGAGNFFKWVADGMRDYSEGKQQGGFVGRVPNQGGNGDRFGTMVDSGSVVLNQRAAGMFQTGGVPVMLEQGEQVFGPNDPSAGAALMMNSMIPRFAKGGVVEHLHGDPSRPGYEPKGHGTSANAHDHFAFSSRAEMLRVKNGLVAMGYQVTNFSGEAGHAAHGHHYSAGGKGTAFDVPWSQFGSGAIGPGDYAKSRKLQKDIESIMGGKVDYSTANKGTKQTSPGFNTEMINPMGSLAGMGALGGALAGMFKSGRDAFSSVLGGDNAFIFDAMFGTGGGFGGGTSGGFGGGGGGVSGSSTPLAGDTKSKAREMYNYLTTKHGLSRNKALGMLANAYGESGFNPGAVGDGGQSSGLFQWNQGAGRRQPMINAVGKNWKTNWKGQLDHAVQTANTGYGMSNRTFGSAEEAAHWFMANYENPAQSVRAGRDIKHNKFIKESGLQHGGVANVGGGAAYSASMVKKSQEQFAEMIGQNVAPIIVPGGGESGGKTQVITAPGTQTAPPTLASDDSSIVAMEYKYRITMGSAV